MPSSLKPVEFVGGFAHRAFRVLASGYVSLEYRLHVSVVQARLTHIMHWLTVCGRRLQFVGERAHKDVHKLIAGSLALASFKLSNSVGKIILLSQCRSLALGGLNALILHGDYLSPKMRQLSSDFVGGRNDLRFIERLYCGPVRTDGLCDARYESNQVHKNPPVVDEGCVRASDSTARGDREGWDG